MYLFSYPAFIHPSITLVNGEAHDTKVFTSRDRGVLVSNRNDVVEPRRKFSESYVSLVGPISSLEKSIRYSYRFPLTALISLHQLLTAVADDDCDSGRIAVGMVPYEYEGMLIFLSIQTPL